MGERARCGGLARVSNVVSDHGRSGAGRDDANRRQASARRLGVVEHGSGTIPLVLLHGWPQTSYAWRHVTPLLTSDCHAIAYDLPGIGSSEPAIDRFDKWSICGDLHASLGQRGIQRPLVVGHGMGAQVAYAYLRRYPTQVRGVILLDTPIAGVGGCEDLFTSPAFWHIGFHQAMSGDTGLAELLVTGREHGYFRSHIDQFAAHPDAISDADVAIYAQGYRGPQRLAAGFGLYRAIPLDIASNERHAGTVDPPILLAFAEYCHATVLPEVAAGLGEAAAGTWPPASSPTADTGLPKSNQPRSRRLLTGSSPPPDLAPAVVSRPLPEPDGKRRPQIRSDRASPQPRTRDPRPACGNESRQTRTRSCWLDRAASVRTMSLSSSGSAPELLPASVCRLT